MHSREYVGSLCVYVSGMSAVCMKENHPAVSSRPCHRSCSQVVNYGRNNFQLAFFHAVVMIMKNQYDNYYYESGVITDMKTSICSTLQNEYLLARSNVII